MRVRSPVEVLAEQVGGADGGHARRVVKERRGRVLLRVVHGVRRGRGCSPFTEEQGPRSAPWTSSRVPVSQVVGHGAVCERGLGSPFWVRWSVISSESSIALWNRGVRWCLAGKGFRCLVDSCAMSRLRPLPRSHLSVRCSPPPGVGATAAADAPLIVTSGWSGRAQPAYATCRQAPRWWAVVTTRNRCTSATERTPTRSTPTPRPHQSPTPGPSAWTGAGRRSTPCAPRESGRATVVGGVTC